MRKIQMIRSLCGDPEAKNRSLDELLSTVTTLDNEQGDLAQAVLMLVGVARASGLQAVGTPAAGMSAAELEAGLHGRGQGNIRVWLDNTGAGAPVTARVYFPGHVILDGEGADLDSAVRDLFRKLDARTR